MIKRFAVSLAGILMLLLPVCLEAQQHPGSEPIHFYGSFSGRGNFSVTLADAVSPEYVNPMIVTNCPPGWLDTPEATAFLVPFQTYEIVVQADAVYSYQVELKPPSLSELMDGNSAGSSSNKRYLIYIFQGSSWVKLCDANPIAFNTDTELGYTDCVSHNRTYQIQIRPDLGARPLTRPVPPVPYAEAEDIDRWDRNEDPLMPNFIPGDSSRLRLAAARAADPRGINVKWSVSMGRLWNGSPVGRLRIDEDRIDGPLLTPESLIFIPQTYDTNEVQVIRSSVQTNEIRQIKAPQTLVDVVSTSTNGFQLKFYAPDSVGSVDANGLYTVGTNAPFVVYDLSNGGGGSNRFEVVETRAGLSRTNVLTFAGTNLWTLTEGTGDERRIETRQVFVEVAGSVTNRIEIKEVKNGLNEVSESRSEVWQQFPWDFELTIVTNDPGGEDLVTTFSYHTTPNTGSYGKLAETVHPDGFWEKRYYSEDPFDDFHPFGALRRVVEPWKDSPITSDDNDCLVTSYSYTPYAEIGSYSVEKWHDAAAYEENEDDSLGRGPAAVYAETSVILQDTCSDETITLESRQFGNLYHYGEFVETETFGSHYGRLSGQIYSITKGSWARSSFDYEFGSYSPATHSFTVGGGSETDVRETAYNGTDNPFDSLTAFELTLGGSGNEIADVYLIPNQSTKVVKIRQNGHIVAVEDYIYLGSGTNFALMERLTYQRDALGHVTNVTKIDATLLNSHRVLYQADWKGTNGFPGRVKLWEVNENGVETEYAYDSLDRLRTMTVVGAAVSGYPIQPDRAETWTYDASGHLLTNSVTAGSLSQKTILSYDSAERLISTTTPDQLTTIHAYPSPGQTNITFSSGATQVLRNYLDRRIASITGTSVRNEFHDYSLVGYQVLDLMHEKNVTTIRVGLTNSPRWSKQLTDMRYVLAEERKPGFRTEFEIRRTYHQKGITGLLDGISEQGFTESLQDYFWTDYENDSVGRVVGESTDIGGGSVASFEPDEDDQLSTFDYYYEQDGQGHWWEVSEELKYPILNDATAALGSRTKRRVSGLLTNQISETLIYDSNTNETGITVWVDRADKKVTKMVEVPESSMIATEVTVNGLLQTETSHSVSVPTWHYYDALGREIQVKDPLGFSTYTTYNTNGQVSATVNKSGATTSFEYYPAGGANAGKLYSVTGPTGKKSYFNYNERGETTHIWGDVPYPQKMEYDAYGDLVKLSTYRGGTGWNGSSWPATTNLTGVADVTTWAYDGPTGLLTNKTDAAGQTVHYDYEINHYPRSTTWARGLGFRNYYTVYGDLMQVDYTNTWGMTSVVSSNYNRLRLPEAIFDDAGVHFFTYDHSGRVLTEAITNGWLNGVVLRYHYDQTLGKDQVTVETPHASIVNGYSFDSYGRINGVANGTYSAEYSYLPNSDLLSVTTSKNGSTPVLTATRQWENGYRLKSIVNEAAAGVVSSHHYLYDRLDRRTSARLQDGSIWRYQYNDRDELISGKRFWPDFQPVAGQQFEYAYDNIGNRTEIGKGGNTSGGALQVNEYTANNLNQYTGRVNSFESSIIGAAYADASVTVNGNAAERQGEYFHHGLWGSSLIEPSVHTVMTVATRNGVSVTNAEPNKLILPPLVQEFTHDEDGNTLSDDVWAYEWDAQNRLASVTSDTDLPTNVWVKLDFHYDMLGRRVAKVKSAWNGSSYVPTATNKFVYDRWNLLAELNHTNDFARTYTWGLDLSLTVDHAGGVGGLVSITDHEDAETYLVGCDGSGNIILLAQPGAIAGKYEYDPFGKTLAVIGEAAKMNRARLSCKIEDLETGLTYFGLRYYSADLARWLSRDPLAENDSANLYLYVQNQPVSLYDFNGGFTLGDLTASGSIGGSIWSGAKVGASILWRVQSAVAMHNSIQQTIYALGDGLDAGELADILMEAGEMVAERLIGKAAGALATKYKKMKGEGRYRDVDGHHIHQKKAFDGAVGYDERNGFSISQEYMRKRNWKHEDMTARQRELQTELAKSGRPNTIEEQTRIAYEALIAGGASPGEAKRLVVISLAELKQQGVSGPTRIPWN